MREKNDRTATLAHSGSSQPDRTVVDRAACAIALGLSALCASCTPASETSGHDRSVVVVQQLVTNREGDADLIGEIIAEEIGVHIARIERTGVRIQQETSRASEQTIPSTRSGSAPPTDERFLYQLRLSVSAVASGDTLSSRFSGGAVERAKDPLRFTSQSPRFRVFSALRTGSSRTVAWTDSVETTLEQLAEVHARIASKVFDSIRAIEQVSIAAVPSSANTPDSSWTYILAGSRAMRVGTRANIELATQQFSRAAKFNPNSARAYHALAWASEAFSEATTTDGLSGAAGTVAEQSAQRAIELDSARAQPYVTLATLQLRQGAFESALRLADTATRLQPVSVLAKTLRGEIAIVWGGVSGAEATLRSASELDPHHAAPFAALSILGMSTGDTAASQRSAYQARRLEPKNTHWLGIEMLSLLHSLRFDQAKSACVAFAGSKAACAELWSEGTSPAERRRLLRSIWTESRGASESALALPLLDAVLTGDESLNAELLTAGSQGPAPNALTMELRDRHWVAALRPSRAWMQSLGASSAVR